MPGYLTLRAEQPPYGPAVVIRGGVLSRASIEQAASRSLDLFGILGISVEGAVGVSVLDAVGPANDSRRTDGSGCPRSGAFGAAGFAMLATFDAPHFTLVLPDLSELTTARLDRCFDEPTPNPSGDPRR